MRMIVPPEEMVAVSVRLETKTIVCMILYFASNKN